MAPTTEPPGGSSSAALSAPTAPRDRTHGFTISEVHGLPENGVRFELIDGCLTVSPSATGSHNAVARWIANILEETNPHENYWVGTDQSTAVDDHNEPRPDVVVFDVAYANTSPVPVSKVLLAVEVVSPTSALRDTETKRVLYARSGVPHYWIVVPSEEEPTIALAELLLDTNSNVYRYGQHYTTDVFRTSRPWPLAIDLPALSLRRVRSIRSAGPSG